MARQWPQSNTPCAKCGHSLLNHCMSESHPCCGVPGYTGRKEKQAPVPQPERCSCLAFVRGESVKLTFGADLRRAVESIMPTDPIYRTGRPTVEHEILCRDARAVAAALGAANGGTFPNREPLTSPTVARFCGIPVVVDPGLPAGRCALVEWTRDGLGRRSPRVVKMFSIPSEPRP